MCCVLSTVWWVRRFRFQFLDAFAFENAANVGILGDLARQTVAARKRSE